jgi:hypothetical protein
MALVLKPEDGPPCEPVELSEIPPPPAVPDTDPIEDPVLAGLRSGIEAVYRLVANLALSVDSLHKKSDHNTAESRAAHAAAVLASDTSSGVARMLREEVMGGLAELDRKVDAGFAQTLGRLDGLAIAVHDQGEVSEEHQRRLDDIEEGQPHLHAVNGNGAAE